MFGKATSLRVRPDCQALEPYLAVLKRGWLKSNSVPPLDSGGGGGPEEEVEEAGRFHMNLLNQLAYHNY